MYSKAAVDDGGLHADASIPIMVEASASQCNQNAQYSNHILNDGDAKEFEPIAIIGMGEYP